LDRDVAVALISPCSGHLRVPQRNPFLARYWLSRIAWAGSLSMPYREWLFSEPAERAWRRWAASPEPAPRPRKLCGQTLLLWGGRDPINPVGHAPGLMEVLGDVDYFEAPACGHLPCQERPRWVVEKLRAFLFRAFGDQAPPEEKLPGVFTARVR
jgi:pimeloyl-ACP methyl ester carboxylesterase